MRAFHYYRYIRVAIVAATMPLVMSCTSAIDSSGQAKNETAQQSSEVPMSKPNSENNLPNNGSDVRDETVAGANTARDGNIAILEEFDHFKSKGTIEAMELFIARHPDHDLVKDAQARINQLKLNQPKQE